MTKNFIFPSRILTLSVSNLPPPSISTIDNTVTKHTLTTTIVLVTLFTLRVKINFLLNPYFFLKHAKIYQLITYNTSRFEVLTVVLEKMQFFWDVTLCQLVKHYSISKNPAASIVRVQEQD